ncbi:MAG: gamma-glutamyl-gamma-aminobutyrate hydrolase family protein [Candidatus Melainabacteria bacterium]|nr:gamma-glutamyl-gamma-aminobutyrate hydrolase family protein [Candidatus Melainabacteria bacterium]
MRPRIGLNLDFRAGVPDQYVLNTAYYEALVGAGAEPVLLAPFEAVDWRQQLCGLSGLVLTGGKDYHPSLYGEEPSSLVEPAHPVRQKFDVDLVKYCLNRTTLPLLGICAGHQLLNISLGGSLIQDIGEALPFSAVEHLNPAGTGCELSRHDVLIEPDSLLKQIYGESKIVVASSHHQAVHRLGRGLKVGARAGDGVIESIELPWRPFTLGVQWHPERDINNNDVLFEAFVEACTFHAGLSSGWSLNWPSAKLASSGTGSSLFARLDYPA